VRDVKAGKPTAWVCASRQHVSLVGTAAALARQPRSRRLVRATESKVKGRPAADETHQELLPRLMSMKIWVLHNIALCIQLELEAIRTNYTCKIVLLM